MNPSTDEEHFYKLDNLILSSSEHVRNVFKRRWKAESKEDWIDDQDYIHNFFEDLGKPAIEKAQPYQKEKLINSNSVEDWDIPLLYLVIQNFGNKKKYWKANEAIWKLKNIRNDLAHRNSKMLSQKEYDGKVAIFKDSLLRLRMEKSEIERLIQRANVTSPLKAYEHVKILFEEAEKLVKDDNVDAAIQRYSEAVSTPNLLPVNLGEILERRAECYLKSMKSLVTEDNYSDLAISDVNKALELNSASWNANYLAAKCHRIKNHISKAMQYYDTALRISPAQKQVQVDFETCKVLAVVPPKHIDLGYQLSGNHLEQKGKWDDSVWRGHQYRYGIKVAQDYTKAVTFYTKADKQGNIEASYYLAECYYFGHGVQQDVKKAFEIFKRVAEKEVNGPKQKKVLSKVDIVGKAQFATGLCYESGSGVGKDMTKAALWYEKAMGNGVGRAANNLGILYSNGIGIKKDEKTAENCWKIGVDLEDGNAAECLVGYYCDQLEPEMAIRFFEVGRVLKNERLILLPDEEFKRNIELVRTERVKMVNEVTKFEETYNLDLSGYTFKQRVDHVKTYLNPSSENVKPNLQKQVKIENSTATECENWGNSYQPLTGKIITELNQLQKEGSEEAKRILQLTVKNNELNYILDNTKEFFTACKLKLVHLLYECAITAFHFVVFKSEEKQKLEKIVLELFEEKQKHSNEDQMKILYCYLRLNFWKYLTSAENTFALGLLNDGLLQYSENHYFYELLLLVFDFRKMWDDGLACSENALKRFPNNAEIMYYRAAHLRNNDEDSLGVIEAYTKFVNSAPREHRKLPEAYYQICYGYVKEFQKRTNNNMLTLIESNFNKGQDLENIQLPCYLPYQSEVKATVAQFLKKHGKENCAPKFELNDIKARQEDIDQKAYLQNPLRRKHIKEYRKMVNETKKGSDVKTGLFTEDPKLKQFLPKKMSFVMPITLNKMKCTDDTIFENRVIDLTILEDPIPLMTSIYLVVEDENKYTIPMYLCNVEVNHKNLEEFQPGCRIGVVNPYMVFDDQTNLHGLRIDEPLCVVYLEKLEDMCGFCGGENSTQRCSLCKRPYCSKECRDLDWKKLGHKLVCSIDVNSN